MTLETILEKIPAMPRLLLAGLIAKNISKEEQEKLSRDIDRFSIALKNDDGNTIILILKEYHLHEYL